MSRSWWLIAGVAVLTAAGWLVFRRGGPGLQPHGESASPVAFHFAGSEACASCHPTEYAAWRGSQHQRAMQHATAETVMGDFDAARFRHGGVESQFFRRDGRYWVNTDGPDGALADFEVRYTYGVEPLQQYLVEFPDGRIQALSIAWDTRPSQAGGQRWFHLYPDERIDHTDELHWTRRAQNWNANCADCHSTDVRKHYDARSGGFATSWAELSVGCEACHGPGSRHLEWAREQGPDPMRGLALRLDERRGIRWEIDPRTGNATRSAPRTTEREIETCAPCHSRRSQIAEGYHAGRRFLDHYRPALLAPGLYHPDGQQRDEVYVWGSFLQSRMHRAGVTCSDCHEPHTQVLRAKGNALCAQCHLPAKYDAAAHHFHARETRCVDCHMPSTTYMVIDPRRDHSLRIPRPDLSVALGVPNACEACHSDRSPEWADSALKRWYPQRSLGFQRFSAALDAAARGAGSAAGELAALLEEPAQPAIARATAAEALARFPSASGLAALRRGLGDSDGLVRRGSIDGLESLAPGERRPLVAPLLSDPLLTVRIEAAAALAAVPESELDFAEREAFRRAAAEFEQVQRANAERPEAHTALGGFFAQRGREGEAEVELRAAFSLDSRHVPAYVNLADLHRARGRDAQAEAVLRSGLVQVPENPVLHHARGLALVRLKRLPEALAALARAATLAPEDSRFAYVYAVALNSSGDVRAALAEIDRALLHHPDDRDLLEAGLAFARDAGDVAAARGYGERLAGIEGRH